MYGFDYTPYPLILSLENRCSGDQQVIYFANIIVNLEKKNFPNWFF